jgi:hypothetical protein
MKIPLSRKIDKEIFRKIFIDHWESFKRLYIRYDAPQYEEPVQKMLGCGKESGGYSEYRCVHCGCGVRRIGFSCKSCFCLSCAKKYVDEFVEQVSGMLHPGLIYRHMILTLPKQLRKAFYRERHDKDLLSTFMRCGHECLEDVVSTALRRRLKIGTIVVVQTHGRSGRYNPHLHIIMTSGGINEDMGCWFELRYFRYEIIHKKWQYHLLSMIKSWFNTMEIKELVDQLWKKYPNGLVAHVSKGKVPGRGRGLARYLSKYVASPPIAVRRIISYNGVNVTYWYKDHQTKSKKVETVGVEVFIGRMVQHIMPKGFQRIRYYGLQATKTFKKWSGVIQKGIRSFGRVVKGAYQIVRGKKYRERYIEISAQDPFLCRHCGHEMVLWKIWHPKYGVIYDEYENLKFGKYDITFKEKDCRGGGCSVRPPSGGIQLPLFPLPV